MNKIARFKIIAVAAFISAVALSNASASDEPVFKLEIKDHKFSPDVLNIPADTKIKLVIKNNDKTPEEFESYELNREKVIGGGKELSMYIGPLKAGEYKFFGEFNPDSAKGVIKVQ